MTSSQSYRDIQYSRMLIVLGLFMTVGVAISVGAVFGAVVQWGTLLLSLVLLAFASQRTRLELVVDDRGVRCGAAHLEWQWIDRCEVLEGEAMRAALTIDAHPTDYLRVRGTASGLRVWLADPSDPHRCWVVSAKDPATLRHVLASRGMVSHAA